jgi:two-component sensor histidine kinase
MNDFRHASKDEADADLLSLEADQSYIRPDSAVAVGMLFTELVINALKYAYPEGRGPIRVALRQQGGAMSLTVEDDGIGYGNGKAHNSTGLGQRIITAMANKLNASVVRDRAHSGTRITVTFKPNTEHGVKLT